jgi:hypothetical protein
MLTSIRVATQRLIDCRDYMPIVPIGAMAAPSHHPVKYLNKGISAGIGRRTRVGLAGVPTTLRERLRAALLGEQERNLECCGPEDGGHLLSCRVTEFPDEIYRAPKSWTKRAYRNLIDFNDVDKGGHIAAWGQPALFSVAPRSLRKSS